MLTIGYIHPGTVRNEFCESLLHAVLHDRQLRGVITSVANVPTAIIAHGRNALVAQFLATDDEYLLMVDTDMIFTINDVYALLDAKKPVIGGLYLMRHGEPVPSWTQSDFIQVLDVRPEPMRLNTVGTGFLLCHREPLEKLGAENADDPWPWFGHDVIKGIRAGEDVSFCHRLNNLGVEVWGHGAVHLGHVGTRALWPAEHATEE